MLHIFGLDFKSLIIFGIFFTIINAELFLPQLPLTSCRSIQVLPNNCNFYDLSSKFTVDEFSTFLQQLNSQQAEMFKSIMNNAAISKSEIKVKLLQLAYTLPDNHKNLFIKLFENSLAKAKMVEAEFDKITENISTDAKVVYHQIKTIYKNDNLSLTQECEQLQTIINYSPITVIQDLGAAYGPLTTCKQNPLKSNIQTIITPSQLPAINNNPPYDFNKGLLIPENSQSPNPFDLSQIFGLNNNNILGGGGATPLNPADLLGTVNEVITLATKLNNLMNGLQNLYNFNLNGLTKMPNGFNLGSVLPPNNNLVNPNPLANFNLNNLLMPNSNNNVNQAMNYPYFNLPMNGGMNDANAVNGNFRYVNPNQPAFRYPYFGNQQYPYST